MDKTWMPVTAGILNIVSGGLSFLGGLLAGIIFSILAANAVYTGPGQQYVGTIAVWFFFLPYVIISAVAIVGGVYCLRRRVWGLALAGSICSVLTIWGWALGVASIVFVAIAKDEFDRPASTAPPG
jgi:hypothetical protein